MTWRMLNFSDVQQHSVPGQLLTFAEAYLDAAEVLCKSLCADMRHANYAHGAVVMSLAFHSLELFFKGCILMSHSGEQFAGRSGHDLDALSKRYFKLYPKKEFQFDVPFRRETPEVIGGIAEEKRAEILAHISKQKNKMPEDQRHRYPTGVDGKAWDGVFGFEANSFLVTLRELEDVYSRVRPLLDAG